MNRYKEKASEIVRGATRWCSQETNGEENNMTMEEETPLTVATKIKFTVNGERVVVRSSEISANLSLARYLREHLHLTGTKISCEKGGCGACAVTFSIKESEDLPEKVRSVNACTMPVLNCDGYDITTIEGVGGSQGGNGLVPHRLAAMHGTQCGFCTPGMVMTMDSLRRASDRDPTLKTVEGIIDGNICRCTGYRPILDAFKTFAADSTDELKKKVGDIEDLKICTKTNKPCASGGQNGCHEADEGECDGELMVTASGPTWIKPKNLDGLYKAVRSVPNGQKYKIVGGNTSTGIYPDPPNLFTCISADKVKELRSYSLSPLHLGAGMNLTDTIAALHEAADADNVPHYRYAYARDMALHLRKVANTHVRNAGTLAGNLMIKHAHKDFPSDVFVLLEATGALLVTTSVAEGSHQEKERPSDWIKRSMDKRVLLRIELPEMEKHHVFASYKIAPRRQNSHAYVNAAFKLKVNPATSVVEERPTLAFGGISEGFSRAMETEAHLSGKNLNDKETFKRALKLLSDELTPDNKPVSSSPEYRTYLAQALMYKAIIACLGDKMSTNLRSGSSQVTREVSSGSQYYKTDPALYPINEPIQKIEGRAQCAGETIYIADLPIAPNELHGAFVISEMANCEIDRVDASEAVGMKGVVAFIDHFDIPGENDAALGRYKEQIFTAKNVHYAGQSVGLIVAETSALAKVAAQKVKVTYKKHKKPILTIADALKYPNESELLIKEEGEDGIQSNVELYPSLNVKIGYEHEEAVDAVKDDVGTKEVKGEFAIGSQHHIHLETHSCIVRPIDDGQFEVECATQDIAAVQAVVATALDINNNAIDIKVRRLGGAYGGKISNPNLIAAAAAVAAKKLHRPIRIVLDLETNLKMRGKRLPYLAKYAATVTNEGKLKAVGITLYGDCGYRFNQPTVSLATRFAQNVYHSEKWHLIPGAVVTNTPSNTYVRAPGSTQGHAIIENVIEHCAAATGMDPLEFRMKNLLQPEDNNIQGKTFQEADAETVRQMIEQARTGAKFDIRKKEVERYNMENRWKKRGLSLVPIRYAHSYAWTEFHVSISVYSKDGTIAVSHGGIEMGQGINTKVAQVVAKELNVKMSMIRVKASNNLIAPNNTVTGGATGTESCCKAAQYAAKDLKARMDVVKPAKKKPDVEPTWKDHVDACKSKGIDLTAKHFFGPNDGSTKNYTVWAAIVTEVEVDVLTGELNIRRADLVEDTGIATCPEVDIGQVEGGYVMALGMWTSEEVKYEPETGKILNFDTWDYHPPTSMDIPAEMRTTFTGASDPDPGTVLGSKAVGEPSVLMGVGVIFAIRQALNAARKENGEDLTKWYNLDGPATVEKIQEASGVKADQFTL